MTTYAILTATDLDALLRLGLLLLALVTIAACIPWGYLADRARADSDAELVDERTGMVAEDVLARVAAERAADQEWRAIERAVVAARFDITLDQIRALPEVRHG